MNPRGVNLDTDFLSARAKTKAVSCSGKVWASHSKEKMFAMLLAQAVRPTIVQCSGSYSSTPYQFWGIIQLEQPAFSYHIHAFEILTHADTCSLVPMQFLYVRQWPFYKSQALTSVKHLYVQSLYAHSHLFLMYDQYNAKGCLIHVCSKG